jgi:hypothetical protein
MRIPTFRYSFLILLVSAVSITTPAQTASPQLPSAEEIVAQWRKAVHAPDEGRPQSALITTTSYEDGIPGKVEEYLSRGGVYRRVDTREFDETETVVLQKAAQRRDWNGFVRDIEGQELSRLRNRIFQENVIFFGPPKIMAQGDVSRSDDGKSYALRMTPPGGSPVTWSIDAKTWLPVKTVRMGEEDGEITTTYQDWREIGGLFTAKRAEVSETNKPDFHWERVGVKLDSEGAPPVFDLPKPQPSDARLDPKAPPIPFNFENSHILFKVSVNGRAPAWFIFDTGADQEVINETHMDEFGLKAYAKSSTTGGGNTAEYGYAKGATFTLPGVELRDQHVAVLDQSGLERALGMSIGGILGYDFISRFVVEIDYKKQLITLHDPQRWSYSGSGSVVPITFDTGIPFTHGAISVASKRNIPAFFVLDFGAMETMTLTSPFVKANDLMNLAQSNSQVNRPAGLENQFFAQSNVRGRIDELVLGAITVQSIPVNMSVNATGAYASPNFSGTVGETLYRRYHVFIDYPGKRVIFEPTSEAAKPFQERQTYGLSVLASGADLHTYTVAAVRPGSPAEKDGFKKGDVITGKDGKPASQFTLGELRESLMRAGERREIEVRRGTDMLAMPIEIQLVSIDKN